MHVDTSVIYCLYCSVGQDFMGASCCTGLVFLASNLLLPVFNGAHSFIIEFFGSHVLIKASTQSFLLLL